MPDLLAQVRGFPSPGGTVDLDIHVGDVVLLAGPNGSGKTSLLRSLAGLDAPRQPASVRVADRDPRRLEAPSLARHVRAALQDAHETLVGLTVDCEFRLRRQARPAELDGLAHRDVARLSSGEARRVSLAAADASEARLLLLDEPVEGLDEEGRTRLRSLVQAASRRGAVVAADHEGVLDDLATRRVPLGAGPAETADAPRLPPRGDAPVLDALGGRVARGDRAVDLPALRLPSGLHAVRGRNGAGKSTLLLHLAGVLGDGPVSIHDAPPVPGANVRLLLPRAGDLFTHATVAQELDGTTPTSLVPPGLAARHPLSLSAGEAQRVALAKTLGKPAPVYLLDEPEAHLDGAGRHALLELLGARIAEGACILMATHDPDLLARAHSVLALVRP
jgi:energy-coupling factor transporter ATP-binding protein EcfA2